MSSYPNGRSLLILFMIVHLITVSEASWFKRFVPQQRDLADYPTCYLSWSPIGASWRKKSKDKANSATVTETRDLNTTRASTSLTSSTMSIPYFTSTASLNSVTDPEMSLSTIPPSPENQPVPNSPSTIGTIAPTTEHLYTSSAPISVTASSEEDQEVSTSIQILTTVVFTTDEFTFTLSRSASSYSSTSSSLISAVESSSSSEITSSGSGAKPENSEPTDMSGASDTGPTTSSSQIQIVSSSQPSTPKHESTISISTVSTSGPMSSTVVKIDTSSTSSTQTVSHGPTEDSGSSSVPHLPTLQTQNSHGSPSSPTVSELLSGTTTPSVTFSLTESFATPSASSSSQQLSPLTLTFSSTNTILRSDSTFVTIFLKTVTTSIVKVSSQLSSSQSTVTVEHSQADSSLTELPSSSSAETTTTSSRSSLMTSGATSTKLIPSNSSSASVLPMLTGSPISCMFGIDPWCGSMPTTMAETTQYCLCPVCYDGTQACAESRPEGTICPPGWLCLVTTPPGVSTSVELSLPRELTYASMSPSIWNSTREMVTRTDSTSSVTNVTWTATLSTSTKYLQNGVRVEFPSWTWLCVGPLCKPVGLIGVTEFAVDLIKCLLNFKCHKPDNEGWEWPPVPVVTPVPPPVLSWMTEPRSVTDTEISTGANDHSSKTTSSGSSLTTKTSGSLSSSSGTCARSTYSTCFIACASLTDTATSQTCSTSCSVATQCSGFDTTITTTSAAEEACSLSQWWNDPNLSTRIASWITQFPVFSVPEIVPNKTEPSSPNSEPATTLRITTSLPSSNVSKVSSATDPSPTETASTTTSSSTHSTTTRAVTGSLLLTLTPKVSASASSSVTENDGTPTTTVPFQTPVIASQKSTTTLSIATVTTPSTSDVRNRCAKWDPVGNGNGNCGLVKVEPKHSEQADDVYEAFCQELVKRKFILSDLGGERHTPGECRQIYLGKNDKDPLSLGIAFDKTGCVKNGDEDWQNGVDMVKYGSEQCRKAFDRMLTSGCKKYWLNCLRFTAVTLDEEDSAPESLPRTTVAA